MMTTIIPENMTTAEKLSAMEVLWNNLCEHSSLESPDWHKDVLDSRELQLKNNSQQPIEWEIAKQQLSNKTL